MCAYYILHVTTSNEKIDNEFEREQEGAYERGKGHIGEGKRKGKLCNFIISKIEVINKKLKIDLL